MWGSYHPNTPHTLRKKPKENRELNGFDPKVFPILKINLTPIVSANLFCFFIGVGRLFWKEGFFGVLLSPTNFPL